jgi:hypothetical protein
MQITIFSSHLIFKYDLLYLIFIKPKLPETFPTAMIANVSEKPKDKLTDKNKLLPLKTN